MIRVDVKHWPHGKRKGLTGRTSSVGVIEFEESIGVPTIGGPLESGRFTLHPKSGRPEGELARIATQIEPRIASNFDRGYADDKGPGIYGWIIIE